MKKVFIILTLYVTLTLSLVSCTGVPQEEYDRLNDELRLAEEEAESLRETLALVAGGKTKAAVYAALLDILLTPYFTESEDITATRFQFDSQEEWLTALKSIASTAKDDQLVILLEQFGKDESSLPVLIDYTVNRLRVALQ